MSHPRPDMHDGLQLVVGLGKSGLSMVEHLSVRGVRVAVMDSRAEPPGLAALRERFPGVPVHLGGFSREICLQAARLLLSPGVSRREPAIQAAAATGIPLWGDIELFAHVVRAPVAAITGSNGKSTVTTLLGEMARAAGQRVAVGGNLGTPALQLLAEPAVDLYVLELSSFQLETTASLAPTVATVLNLSADHLDRYDSLAEYAAAKQRIFLGVDCQVLNRDDPVVRAMAQPGVAQCWFGLDAPAGAADFGVRREAGETWLVRGSERWLATASLSVVGDHNIANALAALAMGTALELPREAMLTALRGFTGLTHRSQLVAERDGVRWVNDSKATNVGATLAAVQGMPGPVVLIAGGQGKGQDFSPLTKALRERVRALVVLGRDGPAIAALAPESLSVRAVDSMEEAVRVAASLARPGDCVLLSPACASFDMFRDFEARGEVFTAAARRLTGC